MQRKGFKPIKDDLLQLKCSIETFVKDRSDANERVQSRQNLTEPVAVETHLNIIKPFESVSDLERALYRDLDAELKKKQHFDPLNLYLFASIDRTKRFRFIHGLKLSMPVAVYRLPKKNMAFVWTVPSTNLNNLNESVNVVKQIDATLPKMHNTAMRVKILQMFKNRSQIEKSELLNFYDLLTENQSIDKKEALDRFQIKINAGVLIEEIYDEEELLTQAKGSKFDNFFTAAQALLDESSGAIPDERRHGTVCNRSPLFISLRDYHARSEEKMRQIFGESPDNNVPSLEWFRLQLTPKNAYANTAKAYKCRINMTWRLQQRLLRKNHPDHHYGATVLRYFKELVQT